MYETLTVLALFTAIYSLTAGRIERTWISGPIIFCTFGVLVGPRGFDILPVAGDAATIKTLAELTLALVLFTDASSVNFTILRQNAQLPVRLLLIGLPLTLGLGYLTGVLLFDQLGILEIALLATMLAPTDAALGKPVITNTLVPQRHREGLNVESGLNDGICVPVLMIFLQLALGEQHDGSPLGMILSHFVAEIGIGAAVGIVLVLFAVYLGQFVKKRGWLVKEWSSLTIAAIALSCFGLAQHLGGSGFIAAFVGGLLFDALLGEKSEEWIEETESMGNLFSLVT